MKDDEFYCGQIMLLLKLIRIPLSINAIAKKTGFSWVTTKKYLLKLEEEGKIKQTEVGKWVRFDA